MTNLKGRYALNEGILSDWRVSLTVSSNDEYDEYVESLKSRLERVESLLTAAGILHEGDISEDDLSDDEYEDTSNDQWEIQRRESSRISHLSDSSNNFEAAQFPGGDDVEVTPVFRSHESDDSRYFGSFSSNILLLLLP